MSNYTYIFQLQRYNRGSERAIPKSSDCCNVLITSMLRRVFLLIIMFLLPVSGMAQRSEQALMKKVDAGDTRAMIELHKYYVAGYQVPLDTAQAISLLQRAADLGDADALAWLAKYALVSTHDTLKAIQLVTDACNRGSAYANVRLAIHLQKGIGGKRNYRHAMQLLEAAADNGNTEACQELALMYLYGSDSCTYDPQKAYAYLKRLPDGPTSSKYTSMYDYYRIEGKPEKARKWMQKGLAWNDYYSHSDAVMAKFYGYFEPENEREAMADLLKLKATYGPRATLLHYELTMRSTARDTTLRDTALCRQLAQQLCSRGVSSGYNILGYSYLEGEFTPIDTAKAIQIWRQGDAHGDPESMCNLAIEHANAGRIDSACHYLDRACALASPEAFLIYAKLYAQGAFGAPDYNYAIRFASEAARMGNPEARVLLGKLHLWQGDTTAALAAFDRAIGFGDVDAYANKAYVYIDRGDLRRGISLLDKGSKEGSVYCSGQLGDYHYEEGRYEKAASYYRRANDARSHFQLGRMYFDGDLGKSSEDSRTTGLSYIYQAAADDYRDALLTLSALHASANIEGASTDSAIYYLRYLVDQGDAQALYYLAGCSERGMGVPQDSSLALRQLIAAGEGGVSDAFVDAAEYYRSGTSLGTGLPTLPSSSTNRRRGQPTRPLRHGRVLPSGHRHLARHSPCPLLPTKGLCRRVGCRCRRSWRHILLWPSRTTLRH